VAELKALMFKTHYRWMAALYSSHFTNFLEFLDLCSSSSPKLGVPLVYLGCAILHLLIKIEFTLKEKKKNSSL
jgi:hypothetical protein